MLEYVQPEDVVIPHPLDEVGSDINQILRKKPEVIQTAGGVTHARSIRVGEVSIFFARFNGLDRNTFTVGLDSVEEDDFTPLTDDFVWDIHNPYSAEEDIHRTLGSLGTMVRRLREEGV